MEWNDEAIVLSAVPHGENFAFVTLLTSERGRHAGLVSGGQSRKKTPILQAGNNVVGGWRARLESHLGNFSLELTHSTLSNWLNNPEILAIIASAAAVTEASLPERQPMPHIYQGLCALFALEDADYWGPSYIKWELGVLQALGYGLDMSCCALSGATEGLAYISPRTGRAVTAQAAGKYADKLLPIPGFLCGASDWDSQDIAKGLDLTGYFLSTHVFINPQNRRLVPVDGMLPLARQRLASFYQKQANPIAKVA